MTIEPREFGSGFLQADGAYPRTLRYVLMVIIPSIVVPKGGPGPIILGVSATIFFPCAYAYSIK